MAGNPLAQAWVVIGVDLIVKKMELAKLKYIISVHMVYKSMQGASLPIANIYLIYLGYNSKKYLVWIEPDLL